MTLPPPSVEVLRRTKTRFSPDNPTRGEGMARQHPEEVRWRLKRQPRPGWVYTRRPATCRSKVVLHCYNHHPSSVARGHRCTAGQPPCGLPLFAPDSCQAITVADHRPLPLRHPRLPQAVGLCRPCRRKARPLLSPPVSRFAAVRI